MKIYEVAFKDTESSRTRKKRYFSNRTDQNGFITSHIGSLFSFEKKDYNIGRNKSDIIKFLNKEDDNG
tara:strand:+ start:524 stop:727 length:204 start_codon:yes stop_codon:yes gene_type:complete